VVARLLVVVATSALIAAACTSNGDTDGSTSNDDTTSSAPDEPAGGPSVTITVDDPDAIGTVGDELLSLSEALELSAGALGVGDLSDSEAGQVQGSPGAQSADEIRFDVVGDRVETPVQEVPDGEAWTPAPAETALPVLTGNRDDHIVGGGVTIANGPVDGPVGGRALEIASSDVSVSGVRFERFAEMISLQPLSSAGIGGIELSDNTFVNGGGINLLATAKDGSVSALERIQIHDNELLGPPEFGGEFPRSIHIGIGANGAVLTAPNTSDRSAALNDIEITDNVIRGFQGGLSIAAVQSISGNRGGAISGLHIEGNEIEMPAGSTDPAIYLWGAVNLGGTVSDVSVQDVTIVDNHVRSNGYAVLVAGVEHLLAGTTTSERVEVEGVSITRNRVSPVDDCSIGIVVAGAFTERGGGPASGVVMSDVTLEENEIEECETGTLATPVLNWGTSGSSSENRIDGLQISLNEIRGSTRAVVVAGGIVISAMGYDNVPDAGVDHNAITGLSIAEGVGGGAEVVVAGGLAWSAPGTVTGNTVEVDSIEVSSDCSVEADARIDTDATVEGNSIAGASC
jgi:hypothetical protein